MAGPVWTDDQERAIAYRGGDLLVSASAGAGKTSVLVERIARLILDEERPIELERLLAVTFTEKAAAEMKGRVRSSLERAIAKSPNDDRLQRQLSSLERAQISTIHAFCLQVIRRYFWKVDLDPSFRVLDANEAELMRQEALLELFEELYQDQGEPGQAFAAVVERYGGAGVDEGLQATVLRLHDFARTQPDMEGWIAGAVGGKNQSWMREALLRIEKCFSRALASARESLSIALGEGGPKGYLEAIRDDLAFYQEALDVLTLLGAMPEDTPALSFAESLERLRVAVSSFSHTRLGSSRKDCDADKRELAKSLRDEGKAHVAKVLKSAILRPLEEVLAENQATEPHMRFLLEMVKELDGIYSKKKLARAGLDFSDLERYCLRVLEMDDGEVAGQLRRRYDSILIDEYQDTNPLQDKILSLVASAPGERGNRFMVGDLKQSIYRFRLAEPRIFLEKLSRYGAAEQPAGERSAGEPSAGQRIDLHHNFRSRREVVDAVNHIFSRSMKEDVAEVDYDDGHELRFGAGYPKAESLHYQAELHLIERVDRAGGSGPEGSSPEDSGDEKQEETPVKDRSEGRGDGFAELEALEKEAFVVAERIRSFLDPKDPLILYDAKKGSYRKCACKDIAILMRSTKDRANTVLEVLGRCDIPAYADTGTGYFQAKEIEVALSLLQTMDNPRQDIPLAAVLRSPIVGLTPADFVRIRVQSPDREFWDAVTEFSPSSEEDAGIGATLREFVENLERWRTAARRKPLADTLWSVLHETGYLDYVGGLPGGAQRQANLRALCDRARDFDSFGRHGLFAFLRFIEKIRDQKGDLGAARALGEQEDVVRVMSVHKSKGLEFPVVIVVDLGKRFNLDDIRRDILFHRDLGVGGLYCDLDRRVKYPTAIHEALQGKVRDENVAEEMRVLYVALTRAKEKLVMVGSVRNLPNRVAAWARMNPYSASNYLDWVCPPILSAPSGDNLFSVHFYGTGDGNEIPLPPPSAKSHAALWQDVKALKAPARLDPALYREVSRRLEWRYPWRGCARIPAKISVSEARTRLDDVDEDSQRWVGGEGSHIEVPSPSDRSRVGGAARGTAVHALLARMRLDEIRGEQDLWTEAKRLTSLGFIEEPGVSGEDIGSVARFLETPLGAQMLSSAVKVRREAPFTMKLPPYVLDKDVGETEDHDFVVVQGVIDALIESPDGVIVLDYKTDRVLGPDLDKRFRSYVPQVSLYALAAQKVLGKEVKSVSIAFLWSGENRLVPWRDYLSSKGIAT